MKEDAENSSRPDAEPVSLSGKRWVYHNVDERVAMHLMQKHGLSDLGARLVLSRVHDLEMLPSFLRASLQDTLPDPSDLPDGDLAFERVWQGLLKGEHMVIWGDYDVDGTSSTALLQGYLKELGANVRSHIPHRFEEGYGLNIPYLKKLYDEGMDLLFTVDCGTSAVEAIQWAKDRDVDVIVIDHHLTTPVTPPCLAFINPRSIHHVSNPILRDLCAAGLVFVFLVGLHRLLAMKGFFENAPEPDLKKSLDLVALGTVCDVMPLHHLNRAFVKRGLAVMHQRTNLGLQTLLDVTGIREPPNSSHIGFTIGPRLNAGGRIANASLGVELLTTSCPRRAHALAQELNALNTQRRAIEEVIEEEAFAQAELQKNNPFLLVMGEGWHLGILGIVAGRLKDFYGKPCFIISFQGDVGHGSSRSIPGVDVGGIIQHERQNALLLSGGGHTIAAGFSIARANVGAFADVLWKNIKKMPDIEPVIHIDAPWTFQGLSQSSFLETLAWLEPFGAGNPRPCLSFSRLRLKSVRKIREQHIQAFFEELDGTIFSAMFFRVGGTAMGRFIENCPTVLVDIAARVHLDYKKTGLRAQLHAEDIRISGCE